MLELFGLFIAATAGAVIRGRIAAARKANPPTAPRRTLHALKCMAGCTPGVAISGLGVIHETDETGNRVQLTPCKCERRDRIVFRRDPTLTADQIEQMRAWQALLEGKGGVALITDKAPDTER